MIDDQFRVEEQDLRLLKSILSDKSIALDFANSYDHNLFLGSSKQFAKAVIDYIKAYKNAPTKRVMLENFHSNEDFCSEINQIWDELSSIEIDPTEFKYDLDKIKDRFAEAKFQNIRDLVEEGGDLDGKIKGLQRQLDEAKRIRSGKRQAYTQKTLKDYMPEYKKEFAAKVRNPDLGKGILTGYSFLDYIKNGMQPAEMMIVAAESGAGKSLLLNNLAVQMWMQQNTIYTDSQSFMKGYNVIYFSLEMPYKACVRRTLARLGEVPIYGLRDARLSSPQAERLGAADKFIARYPYEFEIVDIPRGVTVEQIESRYLDACSRFEPDIIVVDYLGLIEDHDTEGDDWLKLGYIAGKLHEFGRVYNKIILTAVQLNRANGKSTKKDEEADHIGMHRIGRSSLIVHHADIAIQIQTRKDEYKYSDMKYHIIKNRDGELGQHILSKNFSCATIKDMDPPYQPPPAGDSAILAEEMEDLSARLQKIGWYNE